MLKRFVAIILCLVITISLVPAASASSLPADDDIETILDVMGIMTYDSKGNFNEGQYVSRAALAKILVTSSQYKGAVTAGSRISPFGDVMFTHWGAPYISVASKNGFMTGYSDGNFRPDKTILYEEALSAILRLLGYTSADYTGAYPAGQIAKAADLGISDGVYTTAGAPIMRNDMAKLIYNMLNTPKKGEQKIYASNLGYTPTSELLTIGDVLDDNVTGPVTVKAGTISSLGLSNARVYRNGSTATVSDIAEYDVIYYSTKSNAVWAYSQKVSGVLESVAPNKESATSVTVSGVTYSLPYYAAQRAFGIDGLAVGKTVTMLLDKNGNVCDAYEANALYKTILGVVTDVSAKSITMADGNKRSGYYATILTIDGSFVDIEQTNDSDSLVGKVVEFDSATGKIRSASANGKASGTVNATTYKLGTASLSTEIKILEMDNSGNITSVNLSRLDGVRIDSEDVLLVSKNSAGSIDGLIIKNVTGDTDKYGIITDVTRNVSSTGVITSYTYTYDVGGASGRTSVKAANITVGPCVLKYVNGGISTIENLKRLDTVSLVTPAYITLKNGTKHNISSKVLVYRVVDDRKILTTLDEAVSHTGEVWAYYDRSQSEGGLVRVIYLK